MRLMLATISIILANSAGCGKKADAPTAAPGSDQTSVPPAPAPAPTPTVQAPDAAPAATSAKPSGDDAMAAAKAWLAAVAAKDADKLVAAVDFPYWQSGTALGTSAPCRERIAAATAKDLATASKCLAEDAPLIELIQSAADGGLTQEIASKDLHEALKPYQKSIADAESTHRFIQVELEGDRHLVLVIAVHQANGKVAVDFVVGELVT